MTSISILGEFVETSMTQDGDAILSEYVRGRPFKRSFQEEFGGTCHPAKLRFIRNFHTLFFDLLLIRF